MSILYIYTHTYIYIFITWNVKKVKDNIFPKVEKQLGILKEKLKANTIYIQRERECHNTVVEVSVECHILRYSYPSHTAKCLLSPHHLSHYPLLGFLHITLNVFSLLMYLFSFPLSPLECQLDYSRGFPFLFIPYIHSTWHMKDVG